jgi:DNA-directed RNA polymerase specialized sigma24 family protein
MEGLSYKEMADVLAIDVNAVRSRLKRAREKLLSVRKEVLENEL